MQPLTLSNNASQKESVASPLHGLSTPTPMAFDSSSLQILSKESTGNQAASLHGMCNGVLLWKGMSKGGLAGLSILSPRDSFEAPSDCKIQDLSHKKIQYTVICSCFSLSNDCPKSLGRRTLRPDHKIYCRRHLFWRFTIEEMEEQD